MAEFYDQLAPLYHLVYPDWEKSIERQAAAVDGIVREVWGGGVRTVLDAACGIGTQALGLAALGYEVTASDVWRGAVERAGREASKRGLTVDFSVADMREAHIRHRGEFDLVIACDNSVPHLLTDEDIAAALAQFYRCVRPGGGCLISVRDYAAEDRAESQVRPYGIREEGGCQYFLFQVWRYSDPVYELTMYVVEDHGEGGCKTHAMRTQMYAVDTDTLLMLMERAGFVDVRRMDDRFFQPVLVGTKP